MADAESQPTNTQLQRFFDLSLELMVIGSGDGRLAVVNPAWEEALGWTPGELLAEPFLSFVHPEDRQATAEVMASVAAGAKAVSFLSRMRSRDGGFRNLRWSANADETGRIYATARDVTDYQEAVAASARHEELWRSVLRTAADPIILINPDGAISDANPATTQLFGYGTDELVGQNVSMLMPEPYRSEHDGYLHRYLETGEARIIGIGRDVEAQKADGTTFPIRLAVSVVEGSGQTMFTGIIHDLSEHHAQEQSLREANESLERRVAERTTDLEQTVVELDRSNRDLEQFAYIASHDLQAPLRNVRQGLELLDEHLVETVGVSFDEEAEELRGLVVGAVGRMEDLINGLLSYSRVNRSGQSNNVIVDLDEVAEVVLRQLRIDLDESDAVVSAQDLPAVVGDETQLRQLFQNLIQNAVKYRAEDRSPEVQITAAEEGDHWRISVSDNGVGIDESQHDRVFELFRRAHAGYGGVGLGLAISQRIVERHGGEIWVESEPGSGATFHFTLPRDVDDQPMGE